jgi:ATP/maltotriose-dependent transcriptional regulator MalT
MGLPEAVLHRSEEAIAAMNRGVFPQFMAMSTLLRGWALARLGRIEEGLQEIIGSFSMAQEIRVRLLMPFGCATAAEVLAAAGNAEEARMWLDYSLATARETEEEFTLSHILCQKAEFLLAQGAAWAEVERLYAQALESARRQHNRWLELRTCVSHAQAAQRHAAETAQRAALHGLEAAYTSFTEGFDLPDMRAAAELLSVKSASI